MFKLKLVRVHYPFDEEANPTLYDLDKVEILNRLFNNMTLEQIQVLESQAKQMVKKYI